MKEQIEDPKVRIALTGNYPFSDFIQRMLITLNEDAENEKFNRVCKGGFKEYKGKKHCIYNMVKSLALAIDFLETELSKEPSDW
jgi:hypothetical protein